MPSNKQNRESIKKIAQDAKATPKKSLKLVQKQVIKVKVKGVKLFKSEGVRTGRFSGTLSNEANIPKSIPHKSHPSEPGFKSFGY